MSEIKSIARKSEMSRFFIKNLVPFKYPRVFPVNITSNLSFGKYSSIPFNKLSSIPEKIISSILTFKGVKRRFSFISKYPKIIIDDYAHHPIEIKAIRESIRA